MYGLTWYVKQNTPVLTNRVDRVWRLRNDAWIAGSYEKRTLSNLLRNVFNVGFDFEKRHVVLHRVPSWSSFVEYAVEVFAEGARLGIMYYGRDGEWGLVPSGALASIIASISEELTMVPINVEKKWVKNKRLTINSDLCRDNVYIIINAGNSIGVAKVINKEKCVVKVKDLAPKGFKLLKEPLHNDLVDLNKRLLEEEAKLSKAFIREIFAKYSSHDKIYVSFSGGIDSTAVLVLATEELGSKKVVAVYSNTGLEYPEQRAYIEKITSMLNVDLVVLSPEISFIEEIARRGIMSVDNRWCTIFMKLEPLRKYYEAKGVKVYLDGARDYESELRSLTPRFSENPLMRGVYRALPIKSWPRMLVQLFLLSRNIPINPLYDKGFTRLGCLVCPSMHRYEIMLSYNLYREIHEKILSSSQMKLDEYLSMKWSKRKIFSTN